MRVVLDRNIVEIRAKNCMESRFTKQNTMDTMNWLSVVFDKAAEKFDEDGRHAMAQRAREDSDALFQKLKEYHYYDDVR